MPDLIYNYSRCFTYTNLRRNYKFSPRSVKVSIILQDIDLPNHGDLRNLLGYDIS